MNSLGRRFCITTAGESHGPAMVAIVDGVPAGLALTEADLQTDLDRRRPGQSKYVTQRNESDCVEILSGVFEGKTTGTSIALLIKNEDQRSRNYDDIKEQFRPGHADYTYFKKYGVRDYRGGGRASARETAMWVAAGAIAKKYLHMHHGVEIMAGVDQIGAIKAAKLDFTEALNNDFHFADASCLDDLAALIDTLRKEGNSVGAGVSVVAKNVPVGWGDPVFDKLDANLAKALMGINAVKAVEIGDGFAVCAQNGDIHRDEMSPDGFLTNHAGGILGGISSGQDITARVAIKPTSSIRIPGKSCNTDGKSVDVVTLGRHDPCVGIRAPVIVEAMVAITLMDACLSNNVGT